MTLILIGKIRYVLIAVDDDDDARAPARFAGPETAGQKTIIRPKYTLISCHFMAVRVRDEQEEAWLS
jgi:hypothetical protein